MKNKLSKEERSRISRKVGQEIIEEGLREARQQLKEYPHYLKLFEEMENKRLQQKEKVRIKSLNKISAGKYKLRFDVFKRDGFRCQYCGRSPRNDSNTILHIDHIKPKSKGGAYSKDNLITSCFECNIGKGNGEL